MFIRKGAKLTSGPVTGSTIPGLQSCDDFLFTFGLDVPESRK